LRTIAVSALISGAMMVGIAFAALAIAWMLALAVAVVFQLVALRVVRDAGDVLLGR
jgi:hypothetical protein